MRIDSAIITGSFSVNGDTFNDLGSYSTTGSNAFTGSQNITGSLVVSGSFNLTESASAFQIQGNGFGQTYLQSPNGAIVLNPGYGGVEITGVNNRFNVTDGYITNLYASNGVVSGSSQIVDILSPLNSFTSSTITKINSLEEKTGSLATTGSNTFFGTQTFSGSVYVKENLIVQGSSSLQNITASAVDIGTNKIILNVNNPSVRYAGISVYDSGSTAGTGSLFWDSVENHWLYEHPSDSAAPYNSAILISGPKNSGNLGEELELVNNYIVKAVGGDHISSSAIYDDGSIVKIQNTTLNITGSKIGIGITTPSSTFHAMVAEEQSGLNSVRIQGITNSKLIALGTNTDYTWIQSHGSVPLYINELGNSTIFNLAGGNVGIGTTNPGEKLTVNGGIGIQRSGTQIWHTAVDSSNNLQFTRSGIAERMTISSDGLVGIGTTSPNAILEVFSPEAAGTSQETRIRISQAASVSSRVNLVSGVISGANPYFAIEARQSSSPFAIVERLRIDGNGNVGIGTNNPEQKIHVDGNALLGAGTSNDFGQRYLQIRGSRGSQGASSATLFLSQIWNGVSYPAIIEAQQGKVYGNAAADMVFKTSYYSDGVNTIERMRITDGGLIGIGTTSPNSMIHIDGGGTRALRIDVNSGVQGISISPNGIFGIDEPGVGNGRFTINTNGRVGIGITNPSHKLSVSGDFYTSGTQENAGGYYYAQGSTILRKTLNITEGVTTTLLSFDQGGSYGHTGGGEILVVFVDPGSPWGVYVWKGLLTIRTVQFTGAYYGSNLSVISTNATLDGSFTVEATFAKTNGLANGEVRVRAVPSSGIGGTAYVYWNGLVTQGGNAY
jgi:hypothetical protein